MRWLITVLMLALLPVQFSWAVVAGYCMHERASAQAQHLGHHEHKHEASSSPAKGDQGRLTADTFDIDCCLCHGLGIGATHFSVTKKVATDRASVVVQSASPLSGVTPSPPERPQWHSLS